MSAAMQMYQLLRLLQLLVGKETSGMDDASLSKKF